MTDTSNAPAPITGAGIGGGVAVGPVVRMPEPLPTPSDSPSTLGAPAEHERVAEATARLGALLRARGAEAGGAAAEVLESQAMIAEDPELADAIGAIVDTGLTAERAVHDATGNYADMLLAAGGYFAERVADLKDISARLIAALSGQPAPEVPAPGHPFVLVARDLAPADTATLDLDNVLALVTADGGPTSHTAILAREHGLVAVVGAAGATALADGDTVIVDAAAGTVITGPGDDAIADANARAAEWRSLADGPTGPGALADGTPVPLLANLGAADGASRAVDAGAEGVGLFRTEFLFLSSDTPPSHDEQVDAYRQVFAKFPGQKVVVRALDAGADKPLSFLTDADEENPALGRRGLRALRAHEEILNGQLAAIAAASAAESADVWVMAPMVATVEEADYFTRAAKAAGIATAGVMVEVPSAALLAGRVLRVSDFASIGTNDLTQYTLAADRMLGTLASYQDPWHPAVLALVDAVGRAGAELGKPVGICGEAAADPLLAVVLVGLGATSLSMSPAAIPAVRRELSRWTLEEARAAAHAALATDGASDARAAVTAAATPVAPVEKDPR